MAEKYILSLFLQIVPSHTYNVLRILQMVKTVLRLFENKISNVISSNINIISNISINLKLKKNRFFPDSAQKL